MLGLVRPSKREYGGLGVTQIAPYNDIRKMPGLLCGSLEVSKKLFQVSAVLFASIVAR
jgi:hypothetical protein